MWAFRLVGWGITFLFVLGTLRAFDKGDWLGVGLFGAMALALGLFTRKVIENPDATGR